MLQHLIRVLATRLNYATEINQWWQNATDLWHDKSPNCLEFSEVCVPVIKCSNLGLYAIILKDLYIYMCTLDTN